MLTRATYYLRKYEDRRNRSLNWTGTGCAHSSDSYRRRGLYGTNYGCFIQSGRRWDPLSRPRVQTWAAQQLFYGSATERRPRVAEIQLQSGRIKRPCHQSHAVRRTSGSISTTHTNPLLDQWISRILVYLRIPVLPPSSSNSSRYTASPNLTRIHVTWPLEALPSHQQTAILTHRKDIREHAAASRIKLEGKKFPGVSTVTRPRASR